MTAVANRLLPAHGSKVASNSVKAGIPRYRASAGPALLSAGFHPFFLSSAVWACIAIPLWLGLYGGSIALPTALPLAVWHAHEMIFGFSAATVAGFLLTAIPNWTGRMPLQGWPLAVLVLLWVAGRIGVLLSAEFGPVAAAVLDLAFPTVFLAVVARAILAGRNWRNLPMVGALGGLLLANALVHAAALGFADTAEIGNRFGIAILLLLISLVGGRIIPSFARNWLTKQRPDVAPPVPANRFDAAALGITAVALAAWVFLPDSVAAALPCLAAGVAHGLRLSRWRGRATLREPLTLGAASGIRLAGCRLLLARGAGLDNTAAAIHRLACADCGRYRRHDARRDDPGDARPHRSAATGRCGYECCLCLGDGRRALPAVRTTCSGALSPGAVAGRSYVERCIRTVRPALPAGLGAVAQGTQSIAAATPTCGASPQRVTSLPAGRHCIAPRHWGSILARAAGAVASNTGARKAGQNEFPLNPYSGAAALRRGTDSRGGMRPFAYGALSAEMKQIVVEASCT